MKQLYPDTKVKPEDYPAIICDLDGTLAFDDHRRHLIPAEGWTAYFEACDKDEVNESVAYILGVFAAQRRRIYILTGRCETVKVKTEQWLAKHKIPYHGLLMRKATDYDPDSRDSDPDNFKSDADVKQEMLDSLHLTPDNVVCVLDDRDVMVQFWRDRGFHCWQVRPEGKLY